MRVESITAPNPGPYTLDGTRTYLIGDTAILDPGPLIDSHIEAILAAQPGLTTILITHRHADHAPAAIPIRRRTGAKIIAPPAAFPADDIDLPVGGGETFGIDGHTIEAIATPGHTAEHICYLTDDGDLFTGDTILGEGTTTIFPPDGHMGDYLASLRRLRDKNPRRIYPAHGPTRDDAIALIDGYIEHRLDRERQIVAALSAGSLTIPDLRGRIYPDLDSRLHSAAETQIYAHLLRLAERGEACAAGDRWQLVRGRERSV